MEGGIGGCLGAMIRLMTILLLAVFTAGTAIRQRIADDPVFEGQWAEVNISRFGAEGIDVEISTMVETRSGRASREATHKLYVDIMQIAQANGLGLAHATDPSGGVVAATQ